MKNKYGWEIKKLGEIYDVRDGTHDSPKYVENGYALITSKNLKEDYISFENLNYITEQDYANINKRSKVDVGDILFAMIGTIGNPVVVKNEVNFAIKNVALFKVSETQNSYFLKYYLSSKFVIEKMTKNAKGATQKFVGLNYLRNFTIPVPSHSIQHQIVSELDALSDIITKKKQQLEELDKLAQATFYDMFGDPVSNERSWNKDSILNVAPAKAYKGNVKSKEGKFWLLNLDMVESNTGKIISINMVDKHEIGNSTTSFNEENVLYSKLRPYLNKVVNPESSGYATSELLPLLPKDGVLNKVFLTQLLRSRFFVNYIQEKVAGAKMPRVSMDIFRAFKVILPPLSLQIQFSDRIEGIEKQEQFISKSIDEVQQLFDYTMDKYFN